MCNGSLLVSSVWRAASAYALSSASTTAAGACLLSSTTITVMINDHARSHKDALSVARLIRLTKEARRSGQTVDEIGKMVTHS